MTKTTKPPTSTKTFEKHDPEVCSPPGKLTIVDDAKLHDQVFGKPVVNILQSLKDGEFDDVDVMDKTDLSDLTGYDLQKEIPKH